MKSTRRNETTALAKYRADRGLPQQPGSVRRELVRAPLADPDREPHERALRTERRKSARDEPPWSSGRLVILLDEAYERAGDYDAYARTADGLCEQYVDAQLAKAKARDARMGKGYRPYERELLEAWYAEHGYPRGRIWKAMRAKKSVPVADAVQLLATLQEAYSETMDIFEHEDASCMLCRSYLGSRGRGPKMYRNPGFFIELRGKTDLWGSITPSAKKPGLIQYTWFRGAEPHGDSQYPTLREALRDAYGDGLRPVRTSGGDADAEVAAYESYRKELEAWLDGDSDGPAPEQNPARAKAKRRLMR